MICPQCQKENPEGRATCAECGATLSIGSEQAEPDLELVQVLETGDATLVPIVHSLLDEQGIEHLVQGEGVQELVGLGRVGGGNLAAGPVRFFVREEDVVRATELIAHLDAGAVELPADQDVESP